MTMHRLTGPNVGRARAADGLREIRMTIVAGPGDLEQWEACADVDGARLPVIVAGRGTDPEPAAACLLATVASHFPEAYRAVPDADGRPSA